MVLTAENYYSKEANKEYMSVSQYKDFAGTYGKMACEFSAVEKLEERWKQKKTTPLLVGSYVDSYFEGTLEEFKKENPEIFTQKGELKANYKQAERIIARMERDPLFMQYMSGEKQVIMTGELFGAEWKIKIDSFVRGIAITDLKVMASITKLEWVKDIGYLDFVRYWGYDIQGAIYQEIVYQNTGERPPFYIAAGTKEEEPNIEVIHVTQNYERWSGLLSQIASDLQGISKRIILDTDKGYYYTGRCEIETEKNNDVTAEIVISCKCEPYKISVDSSDEPWKWDTFSFINGVIRNTSDITISSGSGWQKVSLDGWVHNETLRIVSNAEMKVRYRNSTYTIYTGENIMYDIVLYKGVNDLYFQGTGKVTLIHRGGML